MAEFIEFSAEVKREGDRYKVTCPEIGISLTSKDQVEALEIMKRWAHSLVDSFIPKDLINT
jgi:hypothetical protein